MAVARLGTTPDTALDEARRWTAAGAGAVFFHLGDPALSDAVRPEIATTAWLTGRTAGEAHLAALPRIGESHVLVGDPLARRATSIGTARLAGDRDGDGLADDLDNCVFEANPDQRDTDGDGFGNRCDADVDGDGWVTSSRGAIYPRSARGDLEAIALSARGGVYEPDHDLDGDGRVDDRDLAIAQLAVGRPPGR